MAPARKSSSRAHDSVHRFGAANIVLVLCFLCMGGCQSTPRSGATSQRWDHMRGSIKLRQAEQHFEGRRFEEALRQAGEAIGFDPTKAAGYAILTRAHLELGRPSSAQRVLETAAAAKVESAELHYLRGVLHEYRDESADALREFESARRIDPSNLAYVLAESESLAMNGRAVEALNLLDANRHRVDDDGSAEVLAAHLALRLGDRDEALNRFRSQMRFAGDSRVLTANLGHLLATAGRCREAVALLAPLTDDARAAGEGSILRDVAACHLSMGDAAGARAILADYARAHPQDVAAQLLAAKAALAAGDVMTALQASDAAQRHAADDPEVRFVRAAVLWTRGQLPAAAGELYDLLQNDPDDLEAHCLLAEVLRGERKFHAARDHFQTALDINPECAWAKEGLRALRRAEASPPGERPASLTSATDD